MPQTSLHTGITKYVIGIVSHFKFVSDLPYTKSLPVGESKKMSEINGKVFEKIRIIIFIYVKENEITQVM